MPAMTGFSRSAFLPSWVLKLTSCLWRYSGNWPAIFGFAGATLLPSDEWHATQTWLAIVWPLDGSALGASFFAGASAARAEPAANSAAPAASNRKRFMYFSIEHV